MVIYEVAYSLGLPAYVVENEMSYTELLKWVEFFKVRPMGWRDDQRAYMLLSAQGVKSKPEDIFPSLRMIKETEENTIVPDKPIIKGQFLERLKRAKNGDKGAPNLF